MRERIARTMSALAVAAIVILAVSFARGQNAPRATDATISAPVSAPVNAPETPPVPAPDSARGHAVFLAQGCARCHSVAGAGSTRAPLDGVGARRSAAELRAWATGAASLADELSPATLRAKQAYQKLPAADLDALVAFLASLKRGG